MAKDRNGAELYLGDTVTFYEFDRGIIVCDLDKGIYTKDFTHSDWSYLKEGILVQSMDIGLIHFSSEGGLIEELELATNRD